MREGVITYDMERRLTFVNPAFERLTGYPGEDIREQEFLHYIHDEDRPAILAEPHRAGTLIKCLLPGNRTGETCRRARPGIGHAYLPVGVRMATLDRVRKPPRDRT